MCNLCDESEDGSMQSCKDCRRLICFDYKGDDDVMAPAYVTSSGDLYCSQCGSAYDEAEQEAYEDYYNYKTDEEIFGMFSEEADEV